MGRKSKNRRKRDEAEEQIFCFYCDREFKSEKILIEHQRTKHFKCEVCFKRLVMAKGLLKHMNNIHKQTITKVPNALPGRESLEFKVYGMVGIPPKVLAEHGIVPAVKRQCVVPGQQQQGGAPPLPPGPSPYGYGAYPPPPMMPYQQQWPGQQMMYPPPQQMIYPPPPQMMYPPPSGMMIGHYPPPPQGGSNMNNNNQVPVSAPTISPALSPTPPVIEEVKDEGKKDETVTVRPPQQQSQQQVASTKTEEEEKKKQKKKGLHYVYIDSELSMEERRALSQKYKSPMKKKKEDDDRNKLSALDDALQARLGFLK